jgi:predicted MFS family arabinose efflux permease
MSVAEASAFSSAGWLIQILTAPVAMLVDALTFVASAGFVARIREPELQAKPRSVESRASIASEVMEGLSAVWRQPILRGMVVAGVAQNLAFGLVGTVFHLYVNQEVGFDPGILGMIFAVGGVSSFLGAMIANRLPRFGTGAVMVASLLLAAIGEAFIPLATAATAVGVLFLVGQQIVADSALTVYDIHQVSLRQAIAPAHLLGRINASIRVTEIGAVLLGTVVAGYIGETVGLRETLWAGVGLSLLAAVVLALSPVRAVRRIPDTAVMVAG